MWKVCDTGLQGDMIIPLKPVLNFNQERIWNSRMAWLSGLWRQFWPWPARDTPFSPSPGPHRTVLEGRLSHKSEMISSDSCSWGRVNYKWRQTPPHGLSSSAAPSPPPPVGPNQNLTGLPGGWFRQDMSSAGAFLSHLPLSNSDPHPDCLHLKLLSSRTHQMLWAPSGKRPV